MAMLGIDFGTKKVGLAFADGKVAMPLRVIRYESRRELRDAIRAVCVEYDARSIVVGVPRDRAVTDEFIAWLRRELTLPVVTEDEQLSTALAKRLMRGWKGKADDDAIAAALILQSYIERQS